MTVGWKGNSIKCDQKVNITAAFAAELTLEGATSVPNILLKCYNKIGITDFQIVLLIHLIRLISEEKEYYPTPEMLADYMEANPEQIRRELAELVDKETIAVSEYFDRTKKKVFSGYDLEPLFLKVSDIWAGTRAKEIEEAEKLIRIAADDLDFDDKVFGEDTYKLIEMFQNEFGALSPIEVTQIEKWEAERGYLIVAEALKAAVLNDVRKFNYVGKVLNNWKKKNVVSSEGVPEFEQQYQNRNRLRSTNKRKGTTGNNDSNKAENDRSSRNKAYIKSLYV
ncbi:MAG: DnaD domain protein [Peptococcaceae bacterium]|nr:DnaD domain protein [Peptococcaceae bacterium]